MLWKASNSELLERTDPKQSHRRFFIEKNEEILDLMTKFESLEANKTHDIELFDSFRAKIKGFEENSTR